MALEIEHAVLRGLLHLRVRRRGDLRFLARRACPRLVVVVPAVRQLGPPGPPTALKGQIPGASRQFE
eukprot:11158408-Lingulodinium_polyedra.AAC.1